MNDPLRNEPKPDDLTQTSETESIQLDEEEAGEISAGYDWIKDSFDKGF
jgi:hypothetical protein